MDGRDRRAGGSSVNLSSRQRHLLYPNETVIQEICHSANVQRQKVKVRPEEPEQAEPAVDHDTLQGLSRVGRNKDSAGRERGTSKECPQTCSQNSITSA